MRRDPFGHALGAARARRGHDGVGRGDAVDHLVVADRIGRAARGGLREGLQFGPVHVEGRDLETDRVALHRLDDVAAEQAGAALVRGLAGDVDVAAQGRGRLRAVDLEAEGSGGGHHGGEVGRGAGLHAEQHRGGVVVGHRRGPVQALGEDLVDLAHHVDEAVDGVHAHREEAPAGGLVGLGAPGVLGHGQRVRPGHGALEVQDGPELARADLLFQVDPGGVEAAVVAQPQRHQRRLHRLDRGPGVGEVHGERLLAEDVFACLGRGRDLVAVAGRRGREHHGVDVGVGQQLVVGGELQPVLVGERAVLVRTRAGRGGDEAHGLAPLHRVDQGPAPPTQAYDRSVQHGAILSNRTAIYR
jgi:hypothetical protein